MKKLIAGIIALALLAAVVAIGQPQTYGRPGQTANGGVVIGDCYHFDIGIEFWGSPGLFVDQC